MGKIEGESPLSKQSKKRARKRKQKRDRITWTFLCPSCGREDDGSAGALLTAVADTLNACSDSGLKIVLKHGAVLAEGDIGGGYILPLSGGRWTARDLAYDRFAQAPGLSDED